MTPAQDELVWLLENSGVATRAQLEAAYTSAPHKFLKWILEAGLGHESRLAELLARHTGAPALVLSQSTLDLRALEYLPMEVAHQLSALPVAVDATALIIATPSPLPPAVRSELIFRAGKQVRMICGVRAILAAAIEPAWRARAAGHATLAGRGTHEVKPVLAIVQPPGVAVVDASGQRSAA